MLQGLARLSQGNRSLLGFLVLVFLMGAVGGPLRGLLPVYVESELRRPPSLSSTLLILVLVGAGVFAMPGGALADRLGQKRVLIGGMASLLLLAMPYLIQTTSLLIVLALVAGLGDGLRSVGSQSYLVAATPRTHMGIASAFFFLGGTFGTSLGSLGAGAVVERWGFGTFGAVQMGVAAVLVVAAVRYLPEVRGSGRTIEISPMDVLRGYRRLLGRPGFLLVACLRFFPTCYWGVATLLMPLLLYRASGSVMAVSIYSATSLAAAAACQLLTGRISDRLGRGAPVVVLALLVPVVAVSAALATRSFAGLFAAGVFGTAVAWSISVNFPPLVRDLTADGEHGQALGFLHLMWVTAMLLGTAAGGTLVEMEPAWPFAIVAVLNVPTALAGIGLWWRLRPREAGRVAIG